MKRTIFIAIALSILCVLPVLGTLSDARDMRVAQLTTPDRGAANHHHYYR